MNLLLLLSLLGCRKSAVANPEFTDAASYLVRVFDTGTDAERAYGIRALEREIYLGMDIEGSNVLDRSLIPAGLSEEDVADLDHPGRDLAANLAMAVGVHNTYTPDEMAPVLLLTDQTPVEPTSDLYERTFLEGEDCFLDQQCAVLRTVNDVNRKNIAYSARYDLYKDYRWVDLGLPDPSEVPEGEEAVNEGDPRWAVQVRSWVIEPTYGDGITIYQSFAMEVWVPRDCRGFVRDGSEENRDGGDWTADSCASGTARMQAMWFESVVDSSDDEALILATTRGGMSAGMEAFDDWVEENQ